MTHTNGIESVWAILTTGFSDSCHNRSNKYRHRHVNEFAFRLNEGNCERDMQDCLDDLSAFQEGQDSKTERCTEYQAANQLS